MTRGASCRTKKKKLVKGNNAFINNFVLKTVKLRSLSCETDLFHYYSTYRLKVLAEQIMLLLACSDEMGQKI